jgi:hypothetical protein
MIANCVVRVRNGAKTMLAGIDVTRGSQATSLSNNLVDQGKLGDTLMDPQ